MVWASLLSSYTFRQGSSRASQVSSSFPGIPTCLKAKSGFGGSLLEILTNDEGHPQISPSQSIMGSATSFLC